MLQGVAKSRNVRGSRLLTHIPLANAEPDEYGVNAGYILKRLPSRRWDRFNADHVTKRLPSREVSRPRPT
jgi:hypothetical protein